MGWSKLNRISLYLFTYETALATEHLQNKDCVGVIRSGMLL